MSEEDAVDDGYGKIKNNFASLFITEIMHEIEEEDFLENIRKIDNDKEKIKLLFS